MNIARRDLCPWIRMAAAKAEAILIHFLRIDRTVYRIPQRILTMCSVPIPVNQAAAGTLGSRSDGL